MAETRHTEAAPGASRGASQRDRFRDSLRDAVDGIDVAELQGTRVPVAELVPVPPVAADPEPAALQPEQVRAAVERELSPLREEIAALRAELTRLYRVRVDRSSGNALIYGGLLLLALIAGAALAVLVRG